MQLHSIQNCAIEWSYRSGKPYADPFNDISVDVEIIATDGRRQIVPADWAGEGVWRVRYASTQSGTHAVRSICSDTSDDGLHAREAR